MENKDFIGTLLRLVYKMSWDFLGGLPKGEFWVDAYLCRVSGILAFKILDEKYTLIEL